GAAYIYARQKGATDAMIPQLDKGLQNLNQIFIKTGLPDVSQIPGAGAAGGVGGGMLAMLNAKLIRGTEWFITQTQLEDKVKAADVVITGEGQLDHQSLQ
ncbi:unnamed protein product, partial [Cyprideis torosa]